MRPAIPVALAVVLAAPLALAQPAPPPRSPVPGALPPATATGAMPGSAAADLSADAQRTAHDFIDTRITWTFGDDDVLTATGQRVPVSPEVRIGDRQQYQLFFDALNSRFAGRENLTHLAMYARAPGFIPRVNTEAALVLRFDIGQLSSGTGNLNQALYDAGRTSASPTRSTPRAPPTPSRSPSSPSTPTAFGWGTSGTSPGAATTSSRGAWARRRG